MSFVSQIVGLRHSLWIEWRIALRFLADNPLQTLLISVAISVVQAGKVSDGQRARVRFEQAQHVIR